MPVEREPQLQLTAEDEVSAQRIHKAAQIALCHGNEYKQYLDDYSW
jgi:hypothetical protein